jgi:hypothetical protein
MKTRWLSLSKPPPCRSAWQECLREPLRTQRTQRKKERHEDSVAEPVEATSKSNRSTSRPFDQLVNALRHMVGELVKALSQKSRSKEESKPLRTQRTQREKESTSHRGMEEEGSGSPLPPCEALRQAVLRACLVSFKRCFKSVTFMYTKMKI